jgi:hypothetical protein
MQATGTLSRTVTAMKGQPMLPPEVITTDHQLEQAADQASGSLVKHRWHWTLDDSNPGRVSITEYARQVARHHSVISSQVNGYALWLDENTSRAEASETRPLHEHVRRASMSSETQAATEAVAKARGTTFRTAEDKRPTEVRRVREMARDRAEKHGTTVEEEAPRLAEQIVTQEKADARLADERKARLGLRFVKAENILARMYREGQNALTEMRDIPWDDEQRQLLIGALANIKALLNLIDMALSGAADVDWDAEMAKLS